MYQFKENVKTTSMENKRINISISKINKALFDTRK